MSTCVRTLIGPILKGVIVALEVVLVEGCGRGADSLRTHGARGARSITGIVRIELYRDGVRNDGRRPGV